VAREQIAEDLNAKTGPNGTLIHQKDMHSRLPQQASSDLKSEAATHIIAPNLCIQKTGASRM